MTTTTLFAQITRTVCASGCDFTTIQAAIDAAVIGDFIAVQDAVHTENSILVNKDVTICGGAPGTIVQATNNPGTGNFRIFNISNGSTVTINDLVLQNGNLLSNLNGGAILNNGDLLLVNCTLTNNRAHRGGAIASSGNLGLIDCTVSNNTVADLGISRASGGGIYSGGIIALVNTTISGNDNQTGGAGDGGGMTILAGAIFYAIHTTIANNTIGVDGNGAGLSAQTGSILELANNIIADNIGAEDFYNQGLLLPTQNTTNIIPTCAGSCLTFITDDPALLPLADNGGCTQTHDLGPTSAAINAGTPFDPEITSDQRGAARSLLEPDIGAVELTATVPPCLVSLLCEGLLPVEFLSFEARPDRQSVVLSWTTAIEVNNEGFAVERSTDGTNWEFLDFVSGRGSTSVPTDYRYEDQTAFPGTNYYRLKQIDFDGQFEYSEIRTALLEVSGGQGLSAFPNPASETLNIQVPEGRGYYRLQLLNSLGQVLWEKSLDQGSQDRIRLRDHDLAPGTYWLISTPNGSDEVGRQVLRVTLTPDGRN
ncbi:hypothetical protein CRP01_39465 [Flavilitoribacter nigricans DSM 23189 = NBRC 102662]|uniref:T9SS type A sorting domain-containing protein n=2 Tax=Flavilitoribacter TaxID=2762562 RepID=A0A2D0MXH9_FLAN2|nr:hypothetical protein CRP01_39465 [Flavilitoribacter nigricans DSM 23189 = NBRC 102662]